SMPGFPSSESPLSYGLKIFFLTLGSVVGEVLQGHQEFKKGEDISSTKLLIKVKKLRENLKTVRVLMGQEVVEINIICQVKVS
ncbi:hypothetical protein PJP10_32530, partial [Mycobacterium kansasii]